MKITLLLVAAVIALAACSKENPVKEEGAIDASKIVFNINIENGEATKGVKTAWESGDVVYVFFEGNTTQYVKMTYNGTSWTYRDKNGGTTFAGLTLSASGKKVSAVYMPGFVCSAAPTYSTDKWTFGSVNGYFQTAEGVAYTVTSTSDVTTLSATLNLVAPTGISQIFIPSTEYSAPASGNEHVLTATHIIPFTFSGIAPGGAASYGTGTNGFPLTPYSGTIGSDTGYYFWGILEAAGTYDFTFQLVERNAEKGYAISSKSKSVASKTVGSNVAVKLSDLTDNGKFVSLGYGGGPLWATGNLTSATPYIANPLEAGDYYMWGDVTAYDPANYSTVNHYSTSATDIQGTDEDTAKMVSGNSNWKMPSKDQFVALIDASNTTTARKEGWTTLGGNNGGRLITSKVNGISLFFAAAGYYYSFTFHFAGVRGYFWSSSPDGSIGAYYLFFSDNIYTNSDGRYDGYSVRPVQN